MPNEIIAASDSDDESRADDSVKGGARRKHDARKHGRRAKKSSIPSEEACLRKIIALDGLVASKIFTPAQAACIRLNSEVVLRYHERAQENQSKKLTNDQALRTLREKPELLQFLEEMFTQEQLDIIMGEVRDDDEGQA